jgi:hypothetical protein
MERKKTGQSKAATPQPTDVRRPASMPLWYLATAPISLVQMSRMNSSQILSDETLNIDLE